MSQFSPTVLVYISQDKYQTLVDALASRFSGSLLYQAGVRLCQLNGSGASNASVADLKDAAAIMILGSETLNSKQRSLTESALYQQFSSAGARNPTAMLLCRFSDDEPEPLQLANGNNIYHLRLTESQGEAQLLQALEQILTTQLAVATPPPQPLQGPDLLDCSGYRPDTEVDDPDLAEQLALIFGRTQADCSDPSVQHAPDAANRTLHQRWAFRNLALGNHRGAISNFSQITALDDGDPTANFWLSRLQAQPGSSSKELEQALRRAELLHSFVCRLQPQMTLLASLALDHKARALHQMRRYDQALEALSEALAFCAPQQVLQDLARMSLQKMLREGDLRRDHVAEPFSQAIEALEKLFIQDHLGYYRFMRQLRDEFSPELLFRLNQHITEKLQKACVPLLRSEQEVVLFCAEVCDQPLQAPGNAKPLPPWLQLNRAHASSRDQLLLLRTGANSLIAESQDLQQRRSHLADLAQEEASVDERIEHSHRQVTRQQQNIRGARIATFTSLVLMIGSAGLFWWSALDRSLAWIPFILLFIVSALFAIGWKRQGEQHRETIRQLHEMERLWSGQLDSTEHSPVTLEGLFERMDFLASQLRERVTLLQEQIAELETALGQKVKRFVGLVNKFELALLGYQRKFDTSSEEPNLAWRVFEQSSASLLPETLAEFAEQGSETEQALVRTDVAAELGRSEVYFGQQVNADRLEQLKAHPIGVRAKPQKTADGGAKVVAFPPKFPETEPTQ